MARGMLYVAAAGLLVNLFAFWILHGGERDNMNMHGAALHVFGDMLGSVAAIVAALVILNTGWMLVDPLLSVLVALLVMRSAWQLVRRSGHILLEGAPEWLDVGEMQTAIIGRVPAVGSIHHVHVWGLTPQHLMLTMHVVLSGDAIESAAALRDVKAILRTDYGIRHSTIEVERDSCADEQ
jgi:cobalt-zinc-cadmium efflux system protein